MQILPISLLTIINPAIQPNKHKPSLEQNLKYGSAVKFFLSDEVRLEKGRALRHRRTRGGLKSCPQRSSHISSFVEGGNEQQKKPSNEFTFI